MSSVLVFLYTGTASQVAIGFFIVFAFLLLVLINRPLINRQLQTLQVYSLVTQGLNLFFGIMLITAAFQETAGETADDSFLPVLLFVLNLSVICLPVVQVLINSQALLLRFRGLTNRLKRMTAAKPEAPHLEGNSSFNWGRSFRLRSAGSAAVSGGGGQSP
eukprot:CAMPEP_0181335684 /NCGR_PEP_ID=MMETSP1101-20121128/26975_1 /TAXON_ID=46948 /ORGANISM="Rhodomonas abbreviata, Strain Caron Lab Isolate" /LENGTH=160 /DNA_ID=CAMNT_0023445845 /DNA_START=30 /DNA_END=509 /DNA_ORIENTATION=-